MSADIGTSGDGAGPVNGIVKVVLAPLGSRPRLMGNDVVVLIEPTVAFEMRRFFTSSLRLLVRTTVAVIPVGVRPRETVTFTEAPPEPPGAADPDDGRIRAKAATLRSTSANRTANSSAEPR